MSKLTFEDFLSSSPKASSTPVGASLGTNKSNKQFIKLNYPDLADRILIIQNHDIKTWFLAMENAKILKDIKALMPKK